MTTSTRDASKDEETSLGTPAKELFSAIAKWPSGGKLDDLELQGTDAQINAIKDAMKASKDFQEELLKADSSLKSVAKKMHDKLKAAKVFEKELGVSWLL